MEAAMLARPELDLKIKDYQSLTAEGRALLRDEAMAWARAERARAVRALLRLLAARLRRGAAWITERWAGYRKWREYRSAVALLESFDDRQLRDIGLRRSEITGAVYGYNRDDTLRGRGAERAKPELTIQRPGGNDNRSARPRASARDGAPIKTAA
jgi:uncharacterized protein YjiS (DUF1127 family)